MRQPSIPPRFTAHAARQTLALRPLNLALGALGYSGHLLLSATAALLMPQPAEAQPYACSGSRTQVCTVSSDAPLTSAYTLSNRSYEQQVTNSASFKLDATSGSGSGQKVTLDNGEQLLIGGSFSGIQVLSHGADGSDNGSQSNRDGDAGLGAMLTTSGSVTLDLAGATASGMVVGVSVSSVGGDGFDQPSDHNNGGNGGNAGSTTLFNSSAVTITGGTLNAGVMGALVESRGGHGGGDNSAVIPYYGGNGGSTQNIQMNNTADIALGAASAYLQGGTRAWGVAAQSVAGSGHYNAKGQLPAGQGGSAANVQFSSVGNVDVFLSRATDAADGVVGLLAKSVGGVGGDTVWTHDDAGNGGSAGGVTLTAGDVNLGAVNAINVGLDQAVTGTSAGILAQSIGGNGGIQQSNGGKGGQGGNAGKVTVDLNWINLAAVGDQVSGVVAYSRGGDGGGDNASSYRVDGGDGGKAGDVSVTLTSGRQAGQNTSISTTGSEAIGVSAQSIGGFGGDAVKDGGVGQDAATAQVTADGSSVVSTAGGDAIGLLVQSIGGGGGTGEDFTSSLVGGSGNGGNGGNGTNAVIQAAGVVQTQGQSAHGMVAQSIGGSGGAGAVSGAIVALGGNGGAGGAGGNVTIGGTATVTTQGDSAIGVMAQSIGGGGGAAGSASGLYAIGGSVSDSQNNGAGDVSVSVGGVATQGDGAVGILAQSIGGGGGSGGSATGITAIGGSGESGGAGGTVAVDPGANIATQGRYALGVVAQSIGGGGGNGGKSLAFSVGSSTAAIGGSAGVGSAGSSVTVQNTQSGQISTAGDGAIAILAQSVGGGGGNGGSAQLDALQAAATVVIGGSAGGGGNGGNITSSLTDYALVTQGTAAAGLIAQSIGGGGGNGGAGHSFNANMGFSLGIAVGGAGGSGGHGSQVTLDLDNVTISTAGVGTSGSNAAAGGASQARADAYGIVAQSIGGGGGNGGSAAARSLTVAVPDPDASFAISADVAVGGSGGSGGSGGAIDIQLLDATAIFTGGQGSHGLVAQSIGGGGGNGGASHAMSTDVSIPTQSISVNVDVAVGGKGGSGGGGGAVTLGMGASTSIVTFDDLSNGVLAQSIGGGGGNAGVGSSGSGGLSQGKAYNVMVGVGGAAGTGNTGGAIDATMDAGARITTYGSGSRGMVLHSVGGGGGASQGTTVDLGAPISFGGGSDAQAEDSGSGKTTLSASVSVAVGATGGSGGDGGAVTLTSQGAIQTFGGDADGLLIQSIGAGGGLGGNAGADATAGPSSYQLPDVSGDDPPSNDPPEPEDNDLGSYSLSVGVGGAGGASGKGGAVTVNYVGAITTAGALADAMVVQSIGGGGGVGGVSSAKGAKGSSQVNVAVGGAGGSGGDIALNMAGTDVNSQVQLATAGDVSYGLLVQSIGGGGGQGAAASDIITKATVQNPSLVLGWGGSGGNGGNGGTVSMNAANSAVAVATSGYDAHGIVLQSIGGGGGTAAISGASLGGTVNNPQLALQMGGGGHVGGSRGGDVKVNSWVTIETRGDHAFGFVAQSIGGGGGIAAVGPGVGIASVSLAAPASSHDLSAGDLDIVFGASSADATSSNISTTGRGSHGIVLQSIVGGGGIGGDTAMGPLALGWADGKGSSWSGSSGNITLTLDGDVYTAGNGAHGVIAQSLSAPGGIGGSSAGSFAGSIAQSNAGAGGTAGGITMDLKGTVYVAGENAWGVFAQTHDTQSSKPAPVTLDVSGNVWGGQHVSQSSGGAIWIDSPAASTVTIQEGGAVDGSPGLAAVQQTGKGSVSVVNNGTLNGNLLGDGSASTAVSLTNLGTFADASLVQGHVRNQGLVRIGAGGGSDTLHVSGDFSQSEQGVLRVGADFVARTADFLLVDGHAGLNGKVEMAAGTLLPNREVTVLQAGTLAHGATVQGESGLFSYRAREANHALTVSAVSADFTGMSESYGLGGNLHAVGRHLQDTWDRGGSDALGALYAQLDRSAAGGAAAYASALSDLSPGTSAAPAALATGAAKGFADAMFSCPWFAGNTAQTSDGSCVWGRVSSKTVHLDGSDGTSSTRVRGETYQFGAQRRLAPEWMLGLSAAYEHSRIRGDDSRVRTKGNTGYLGAVLKYESGPWTLGGALYGSYGSYDGTRRIGLANVEASSDFKVWSIGQQLRASYLHGDERHYFKPFVALDLIYTRMPSYQEQGAGALNLHVRSADRTAAVLTPGVEVGGRIDLANGNIVRPYVSLGVSLSSANKWRTHAYLAGRPAGSADFDTTLETGSVYGLLSAGVQLIGRRGFDLQLQYDGVLSDRARSSSGAVKATWRF